MANRYWVGGTGDWDNLALLKWASTSGGLGGQTVPTSADNVFFDANSGANTVTIGAGTAICSTLTMTGFTGTLAFGSNSIDLAGLNTVVYRGASTLSVTGTPLILVTGAGTSGQARAFVTNTTTEANAISFNISAGADSINTGSSQLYKSLIFSGTFTGSLLNQIRTIYGNLTFKTGMTLGSTTSTTTFAATSGIQTITSAALNLDFPITINAPNATVQLQDALAVGTTTGRNITLTSGTLDLNDKTLTIFGAFVSSNTNTRSVLFGTTGNITLTNTATTIFNIATATNFSITGTPTINVTANATTGIRRLDYGNTALPASPEANSLSFYITAGSDSIQITSTAPTRNLDFTGSFTGALIASFRTIYGNYTLNPNMTVNAGANITTFAATSGTQLITTAGLNLNFPITINAPNATVQLQDALLMGTTTGRNLTLVSGTLDLNNNTVTIAAGSFVGSGSTTRTLAFGTGQFYLGGTVGSVWSVSGTDLTITGTDPTVNLTANATTGERTFVHVPTPVSQALSINLNVTAGSSEIGFGSGAQVFNNLNFTGYSGAIGNAGLSGNSRFNIYGNLTMGAGMTCIGGNSGHDFRGTGTQLITVNGVAFDQPISCNGTGIVSLQDAFVTGATKQINLNSGTLQTNNYSLTCGTFAYSNSTAKEFNLGTSVITILGGSGTTGWVGSNSNTAYTSVTSSTIVFTTTGTAAFSGGQGQGSGNQFGTITMSGLGGTLILGTSGGQTVARCTTLNNTVSPCTFTNSCTTAFTVDNFNVSGTAGNLVTLNSNVAGTRRTINQASGTVNAYYLNIQDSTADGGAVWYALNSTDAGNNTGWNFLTTNSGNFFMMF
jgi:hypothetical protein